VRAIEAAGGSAVAMETDVRDAKRVAAMVDIASDKNGRLDYFFNNAGIGVGGESLHVTVEDWRYIVDVNIMGVVHGIAAVYPRMVRQGFGHIISTASMAGLIPSPYAAAYSATKHAVVGLSRALRIEAEPHGVRVSALCPGAIRTPILGGGRHGRIKAEVSREQLLAAWEPTRPMDPAAFAERVLDQVARNRPIIIVPGWWKLAWWMDRGLPGLFAWLASRSYRDMKARFTAGGATPR
jgi:short-subunit dehydrogenase